MFAGISQIFYNLFKYSNMMHNSLRTVLFALLLIFNSTIHAQNRWFTMEEATLGLNGSLAPEQLKQFQWIPQSNNYVFLYEPQQCIIRNRVPEMTNDTLLRLQDINKALIEKAPLKRMPAIQWVSNASFYFRLQNDIYWGENIAYKIAPNTTNWTITLWASLPEKADNIQIDVKTKQIAYTLDNNLLLLDPYKQLHHITSDNNPDIINGQAVHRNEFGIEKGIFISPKGNYVAFYRMDQSMVADYPIIDWNATPAQNQSIKYPMAGGVSHEVSVGVYNPITKKTVFLQTGTPKDQYLTCVTWSPDEQHIFVALLNRDQNHLWLNQYDATSGAFVKTLFEETDPKYVEPQHELAFLPGAPQEFLWWSQRSGYMHLYRYNTNGNLLNTVTSGNWVVNDIIGFNEKEKTVFITGSRETPLGRNIYKVNWRNGNITRLDQAEGTHTAYLNSAGTYVYDAYQNADVPRIISIIGTEKKWKKDILAAANPLAEFQRPTVENITLKADDGTPLYGKLILPAQFDENRKYPVIVYLYNGPHVQLVNNRFPASGNLWYEYLAQRGYIVFTMDGRGSSNRGLHFEQATFRQLGKVEMEDQLQGVAFLKSLPYVDADRMGVHGWSFGGFMTTSLMLRYPGIFKCAVAGGPVIDWSMYEVMYTERYMDQPQNNPTGYSENNLLTQTNKLQGKLLMIHGAQDNVVVWQHSVRFIKACVDNGIQLDYFIYPGHEHNVRGKDRVHLMQKITDYFDLYLQP